MQKSFILACSIAFSTVLFSCVNQAPIVISENHQLLDGKWKLVKISFGYPAPNMPNFTTNVGNEEYEFDGKKSSYIYKKAGKMIDSGTFSLDSKKSDFMNSLILKFDNLKLYTNYTFSNNNKELILYERVPEGAILADGNNYHFVKQ